MKTTTTGRPHAVNAPEHQESTPTPILSAKSSTTSGSHIDDIFLTSDVKSLNTEPTDADRLPCLDNDQAALMELPSVSKHPDLHRATETKRAALHVAEALATSPDEDQALRGSALLTCADQIREDKHGALKPIAKCKHRACPICEQAKQRVHFARFRSALGYLPPLLDEAHESIPHRQRAQALKITLNMGQACRLSELKSRIQGLNQLFKNLREQTAIKGDLLGFLKTTEVTQAHSAELRANPHIHGVLLIRGDADLGPIIGHILTNWPRMTRRYHTKRRRDINTAKSAPEIKPLDSQTRADLLSWVNYILKGGTYDYVGDDLKRADLHATSPDFWRGYDKALKGLTLISKGGDILTAMSKADDDYKAQLMSKDSDPTKPSAPTSDRGSKIIKPSDYIFLRSVSGYAKRSVIELIHRTQMSVKEYLQLPNVTGRNRCSNEDLFNEVRSITLGFSAISSFTLAMIVLNRDYSGPKWTSPTLSSKVNTRTSNHWSEPKDKLIKGPEDDPKWRPTKTAPEPPPELPLDPTKAKP